MKYLLIFLLFISSTASGATSLALYNFTTGNLESSHRHTEISSIASITKLFTAVAIVNNELDLKEKVKVQGTSTGRFIKGTFVSRLDLMKAMLIASDNLAADSLAHSFPGGYEQFLTFINEYAGSLGLNDTKIVDASGLNAGNVSTAYDLVNFAWHLRRFPLISSISSSVFDKVQFDNNKKKPVTLQIRNTNPDIQKYNILVSKTGFTNAAGRCLLLLVEKGNETFGVVVLGFKNPKTRSEAIAQLINLK